MGSRDDSWDETDPTIRAMINAFRSGDLIDAVKHFYSEAMAFDYRDKVAMHALVACLAESATKIGDFSPARLRKASENAYRIADAMLAARKAVER